MNHALQTLENKKNTLNSYQPLSGEGVAQLEQWLKMELTYTSNALEGSSLSREETQQILEKKITVGGKTIKEHIDVLTQAQALDWIEQSAYLSKFDISERVIINLHHMPLSLEDSTQLSSLQEHAFQVPYILTEYVEWLHQTKDPDVKVAADAVIKLVNAQPFASNNGRTARLLMNLLLLQADYPPIFIREEDQSRYASSLESAIAGSPDGFYALVAESLDRSLDLYLAAVGVDVGVKEAQRLTIGQLAQRVSETVPTIRYWTKQGLLKVTGKSDGGYQLYDERMVAVAQKIRRLQRENRLTIKELKQQLG